MLVCSRGEVLGRRSLGVRVCSCPRRDMEKEEAELRPSTGGPPPRKKAMLQAPPQPLSVSQNSPGSQVSNNLNLNLISSRVDKWPLWVIMEAKIQDAFKMLIAFRAHAGKINLQGCEM